MQYLFTFPNLNLSITLPTSSQLPPPLRSRRSDAEDGRSFTAMHTACRHGNPRVVITLIEVGGANVNQRGFAGATPLHVSAVHGHASVTTVLLDKGADASLTDDRGRTPSDVAKSRLLRSSLKQARTLINSQNTSIK